MEAEEIGTNDFKYRVVKDANIERYFAIRLEVDDDDFWYDEDENLLGVVVEFREFPDHETLVTIFDDLRRKAVMSTQDCDDEDDAQELIDDCDDEEDYPDELDLAEAFSVFFTVDGHSGLYRCQLDSNDYWIGHSTGRKGDRWSD